MNGYVILSQCCTEHLYSSRESVFTSGADTCGPRGRSHCTPYEMTMTMFLGFSYHLVDFTCYASCTAGDL